MLGLIAELAPSGDTQVVTTNTFFSIFWTDPTVELPQAAFGLDSVRGKQCNEICAGCFPKILCEFYTMIQMGLFFVLF